MKTIEQVKSILAREKERFKKEYGITYIGIFGSWIRGDHSSRSDIDILVELSKPPVIDLFTLIELEQELSEKLGIKVDLVIKEDLKPRIGKKILKEVVPV